ncbi:hypothetical protein O0L34_g11595 [Tuta absoluta]|nr:hypothetical protein O0L34_g11595 [Tuta absoluta]
MNLGDPELELIDPTPNIHNLFIQFDKIFFCAKLASRAVVRWSKRMYSCAGICSYEGRGGLCDIALSEPLLKLRPRKNLVETLLHEMIHAYLFITCRDLDRDGHGPNFKAHMHRINKSAGINITIYHDFHDEVKLYQNHVWRCNGPCQQRRPYFGIVRKTAKRPPGPKDYWWENHRRYCGGTYIKIKEPEKPAPKNAKKVPPKPSADITKYINTSNTVPQNVPTKPVLKDSNHIPVKTKSNGGNTVVITKKGPTFNPKTDNNKSPVLFSGKGQTLTETRPRANSVGVVETVRNIWATKQLPTNPTVPSQSSIVETLRNIWATKQIPARLSALSNNQDPNKNRFNTAMIENNKTPKHKIESHIKSPPAKVMKIDDYFKTTASSLLKDVYGKDFQVTQVHKDEKLIAVADTKTQQIRKSTGPQTIKPDQSTIKQRSPEPIVSTNMVDCPVCNAKVGSNDINRHLDECLNKDVIETLCKDNQAPTISTQLSTSNQISKKELKEIVGVMPAIPAFTREVNDNLKNEMILIKQQSVKQIEEEVKEELNTAIIDFENDVKREIAAYPFFDQNKVKEITKNSNFEKVLKKSDKEKNNNGEKSKEITCRTETPKIKVEPGTSMDVISEVGKNCACCGKIMDKPIDEHLDECLAFFDNNNTIPNEGASTSFASETIVIDDDDDDIFDESQTYNATGTKTPCPCCLAMVEEADMKNHLDVCLDS